jgi:hypothetical protein
VPHATTFIGTISPQAGDWHLDEPFVLKRGGEEIRVVVAGSAFNVRVLSPEDGPLEDSWVDGVWLRASAAVRALLDALGYHLGAGLEIQMISGVVDDNGVVFPATRRPFFATVESNRVEGGQFLPYALNAIVNPHLRHALADVRQALVLDDDCAFYCYRAIESLRQNYVEGDHDDRNVRDASWEALRNALNVTRTEIDEIREAAMPRRHGGHLDLDYAKRVEMVITTRKLVGRYVDTLPEPEPVPELQT